MSGTATKRDRMGEFAHARAWPPEVISWSIPLLRLQEYLDRGCTDMPTCVAQLELLELLLVDPRPALERLDACL